MTITGTITYQDFEGGFWGILGDDDRQYLPIEGIPESLQQEGLRIAAEVEPAAVLSFRMWGQAVEMTSIHRL